MKALLLALATAAACCQCATAYAATRTATLDVSNRSCVTCPLTVKVALKKVPGVGHIEVDYKTKQAVVTFDDTRTSIKALQKATADVGFPSTLKK